MFSKIAKKPIITASKCCRRVPSTRSIQSFYKPGRPVTFIDAIAGVYEDPQYALDVKPLEWRDEQVPSWFNTGSLLVMLPILGALFLETFALLWSTFEDTSTVPDKGDPFPMFHLKNGKDYYNSTNPTMRWMVPFGWNHKKPRYLYYQEIDDAIKRRHNSQ